MNYKKGFTIIELIVVIAIIAVLAGIVMASVIGYIANAKLARANTDTKNIETALEAFYAQYGDYPWSGSSSVDATLNGANAYLPLDSCDGGVTDPNASNYCPHFSQFYKSDFSADYFVKNAVYQVNLWDENGNGKIDCGIVEIKNNAGCYGHKFIICGQGCTCGTGDFIDIPFHFDPKNDCFD